MNLKPFVNPDAKLIFNAARDGKLYRLKSILQELNSEEIETIVNTKISGATPLVMACRNGHLETVKFLIHHCKADVEITGSVLFDGETIEGAPPLWCAAAAGHPQVVKFLISAGANVNSTTYTNSTPLRAACFDGHYDIVQFLVQRGADVEVSNHHGHTCLMIACYKGHYHIAKYLLSLNADVNRKSEKGNTALHDCAESGNLDILKLLIKNGAIMDVDAYGMTPLLAASVTGHKAIVDYIIELPGMASILQTIDALELLGATYVDKGRNMNSAYELWRKAMEMRYDSKHPIFSKSMNTEPVEAYEYAKEVQTREELLSIQGDPDAMRIQALLIRERILGPAHPDTSYYIRLRGALYADAGRFSRCISLWKYALEMQQSMLEPLNPLTQSSIVSFTELFALMMDADSYNNSSTSRKLPIINFGDIMTVLAKCIQEVVNGAALKKPAFDEGHFQRVLVISLHLCCVLAKLLPFLSAEQKHEAHLLVYSLVKLKIRGKGDRTLLHYVCTSKTGVILRYDACQFPCAALVKMLCRTGADVNARDNDGNTPLHLTALSPNHQKDVVHVLLQNGAHLDTRNNAGLSFKELLNYKLHSLVNEVQHISLACLAARVVRKHRIPFEEKLPKALHSFVMQH